MGLYDRECIFGGNFRVEFPILDNDGDPVPSAAGLDSEIENGSGSFANCTNEATEIGSTGIYYLDLTHAELTALSATVRIQTSTTDAKTTILTLKPRLLPVIHSGTAQGGDDGEITLDANASDIDDYYVGCIVNCTNNTPSGVQGQNRRIVSYNGSSKVAGTVPSGTVGTWGTNPSSSTTFEILATEEWYWRLANLKAMNDSESAATLFAAIHDAMETLTVDDANFTPTTTQAQFTAAVDLEDEYLYQGLFGLTGANAGVTVWCSGYTYDSGNSQVRLTFDALEAAPSDGDTFLKVGRRRST